MKWAWEMAERPAGRGEAKISELKKGIPQPEGIVRVQPVIGVGESFEEVLEEGEEEKEVWVRRMGIRSSC